MNLESLIFASAFTSSCSKNKIEKRDFHLAMAEGKK